MLTTLVAVTFRCGIALNASTGAIAAECAELAARCGERKGNCQAVGSSSFGALLDTGMHALLAA